MGNIVDIVEPGGHRLTMLCGRWAASGYNPAAEGVEAICSSSAGVWASLYLIQGRIAETKRLWLALSDAGVFGLWNFLQIGTLTRVQMVFDISRAIAPLDFAIIDDLPVAIIATIFRESDGQVHYEVLTSHNARELLGATIAIPPFSEQWFYRGESFCDGGGADPLPVARMIEEGFEEIRLWLNRHEGFSIPFYEQIFARIPWPWLSPAVRQTLQLRIERFREAHNLMRNPPPGVRIRAIYPPIPSPCRRIERDWQRIEHAWQVGEEAGCQDRRFAQAS